MRFASGAIACAAAAAGLAAAQSQPTVLFRIELADASRIVDCPVMSGALGESFSTVLANGMIISGGTTQLADDGLTEVTVHFPAGGSRPPRPMTMMARLTRQKPSLQSAVAGTELRLTVEVESPALLATTRARPSWREFHDGRASNAGFERLDMQATCTPLLRQATPAS